MPVPPSSRIVASRRLTGPNLFSKHIGAVLEVVSDAPDFPACLARWAPIAQRLAERLHWNTAEIVVRPHAGGAQCFLSAPLDALLAATEVAEQAWLAAEAHELFDEDDVVARLRVAVLHERTPHLVALAAEAEARSLAFLADDDDVSVGLGSGSITWNRRAIPAPNVVNWDAVHDIPVALVTGSNGKTTTTRLVAAIMSAAGMSVALTSTDGVQVAGETIDKGDYSGPAGARLALRDKRTTCAVLETARGGILRRGLALQRADVAVITRVAADHFGEYGITDVEGLTQVKLVIASIVPPTGRVVLNADDPNLVRAAPTLTAPITWFSLAPPIDRAFLSLDIAFLEGEELVLVRSGQATSLGSVRNMPMTLGGTARHNIANALAAVACADALGASHDVIRRTLERFGRDPRDNPGRLIVLERNGVRVIVDYVHNPDGWDAMHAALRTMSGTGRRLFVVGQAGDRDDSALIALAHAVARGEPDIIYLKELPRMFRGRLAGETTAVLAAAFESLGIGADRVVRCADEQSAVVAALAEARPGDLVVLSIHEDYDGAMRFLADEGEP